MKKGQSMNNMYKRHFSDFVINFIFEKTNKVFQDEVDNLVIRNVHLLNLNSTYGFIFDGINFIHSNVTQDNIAQQQFARSKLDIPHDDILGDVAALLQSKEKSSIDKMRFKGLINGMLSVVRTNQDFNQVFDGMFIPEIAAFNLKFSTNFGKPETHPDGLNNKLTFDDIKFVSETKEKFKISYDRYRILTDVLGL